jgi:uncharacterized protein (DUF885 family)
MNYITTGLLVLMLTLPLVLFSANAVAVYESAEQKSMAKLQAQYRTLELTGVTLEFTEFMRQLRTEKQGRQTEIIEKIFKQIEELDQNFTYTFCQQLMLDEIRFNVSLAQERERLLAETQIVEQVYNGRFLELPHGRRWYQHWLNSWLQVEVDVNELKDIAYQELADVKRKRVNLSRQNLPRNLSYYLAENEAAIVSEFRLRENQVNKHISNVLGTEFIADKVNIERSNLPKSFPAPGIYNSDSKTFLYHLSSDRLPANQMDWLFLHEGSPGHHYQSQFVEKHAVCKRERSINSTVFHEGWGAYVETLGQALGLFKDADSMDYALDWQALRAVRVLIDIGIHYEGLTDKQAQQLWMEYIPQQRSIMSREIARIKRWPVQVITYVYGKHTIERTIERLSPSIDKKTLHRDILSYSNMRLSSLKYWVDFVLNSPKNQ